MTLRIPKLSVPVWLTILFACVVSVRLILLTLSSSYPVTSTLEPRNDDSGWDSGEYIRYAKNLAFHGTFSHSENAPYHPSAFRTPVYPMFLAPFFRLASNDTQALLWITMAQIGLAGISALLLYAIAVHVTGNKVLSWAAAAIASLDLYSIRLNYMIATETLFIALLLATTLVFLRYLGCRSAKHPSPRPLPHGEREVDKSGSHRREEVEGGIRAGLDAPLLTSGATQFPLPTEGEDKGERSHSHDSDPASPHPLPGLSLEGRGELQSRPSETASHISSPLEGEDEGEGESGKRSSGLESSRLYLAGSMALLVVTGLCRPMALYFLPVFLLFVVWRESNQPRITRMTRMSCGETEGKAHQTPINALPHQRNPRDPRFSSVRTCLIPVLLALAVFALTLAPWVLRNWSAMNYFVVYTNGSFMNAFLANGLLTVKKTGNPIPMLKIKWQTLDQSIEDSLTELNEAVGTTVRYDARMRHLLGLDHPEHTKRFESIFQARTDRILRETRMAHLKSSVVTFLCMPFWTPQQGLLCLILGEKKIEGVGSLLRSVRQGRWSEGLQLLSELRCCKVVGYVWTHAYLICLNVLGLIGLVSLVVRMRRNDTPHPASPSGGEEKHSSQEQSPVSFPLPSRERTKVRGIANTAENEKSTLMPWMFLAILPFLLMAAPSWGTALGWEMPRFRSPAISFIAIFAVVGFALLGDKFCKRKTKCTPL